MFQFNQRAENISLNKLTESTPLLSDEMFNQTLEVIIVLVSFFVLLGVFTNTANIIVFWRIGFSTVTNISFFTLSFTDLLTLIFIAITTISNSPFYRIDVFMPGYEFSLLANPLQYSIMAISSWITAVISMERCCCIMFPMKVRRSWRLLYELNVSIIN